MADGSTPARPMDDNARRLVEIGQGLFSRKAVRDELNQTLAEIMYPERATFTTTRIDGSEYARDLYESTSAQNRRDLSGSIGAILRPRGKEWFKPKPKDIYRRTRNALAFSDFAADEIRGFLYNERSRFQVMSAQADDDFVTFGNAVPILTESPERNGFLFELTHLRDNAWTCNRYKEVSENYRKFKDKLVNVASKWGERGLSEAQKKTLEKQPDAECEIWHIVMPIDNIELYRLTRKQTRAVGFRYASIYINPEAQITLSEGGYFEMPYLHRRWREADDSDYGYSPAAMLGLVDARVLQSQARIMLDAGELHVAPPMVAKKDAVLGNVKNYPSSVTWIDPEYDERFGDALRAIDVGGDIRLGLEMKMDTRKILESAFFLNKLNLPSDKDMTAYEVSERVAEYIRSAGPVFEPFEADNARMLSTLFSMAMRLGYFGPPESIPPEIRMGEIEWEFDTPVQQAYRRLKVVRARETMEALGPMAQVKPEVLDNFDIDRMARDTATAIGGEVEWQRPQEMVDQDRQARAQEMEQAKQMEAMDKMSKAAAQTGAGAQRLGQASLTIPALQQQLAGFLPSGGGEGQNMDELQWPEEGQDPMLDLGRGFGSVLPPGHGGPQAGGVPPTGTGMPAGVQAPQSPAGQQIPPELMRALMGGRGMNAR